MSAVTSLLRRMQEETGLEIANDIIQAVEQARAKHGGDPAFPMIVAAAIGHALDELGLTADPYALALASALADRFNEQQRKEPGT
jgi:hypothetical protein